MIGKPEVGEEGWAGHARSGRSGPRIRLDVEVIAIVGRAGTARTPNWMLTGQIEIDNEALRASVVDAVATEDATRKTKLRRELAALGLNAREWSILVKCGAVARFEKVLGVQVSKGS